MAAYDELENSWGVEFVEDPSKPMRKTEAMFDKLIRSSVPGYQLERIQASGTHSNMVAMQIASNYDINKCLFALGTYVGGDEYLQEISTSMYDPSSCLSVPKFPENATDRCFQQTVPLPYHVRGGVSDGRLIDLEDKCLRAFHKRLIMMALLGNPCRAFLLEYILGGNGAELSHRFLEKLGILCKAFSVAVVADEVLTGARVGERYMAMTPSMPRAFKDVVEFITMGKFIKCSLVLKKIPRRPTSVKERIRGTSTVQECGSAYFIWEKVVALKKAGAVAKRNKEVLEAMRLDDKPEAHWGMDLLLFTEMKRPQLTQALKNRLLPKLVIGLKVRRLKCESSKWTREFVSKTVIETSEEWLVEQEAAYNKAATTAFLAPTLDLIFFFGLKKLEPRESSEWGYFRLRPEDVVNFIGTQKAAKLALELRKMKEAGGRPGSMCKMTALSFAKQVLFLACVQSAPASDCNLKLVKKKRKTLKRTEFTFVHSGLFGAINKKNGLFACYS